LGADSQEFAVSSAGLVSDDARVPRDVAYAHYVVSVVASFAVVLLARRAYRWLAWAVVPVIGVLHALLSLGAAMAMTGAYL
jgi:predicted RND superfamily exporter protein